MLDTIKEKILLPLIYAGAVVFVAIICLFMFLRISPFWLRLLPPILAVSGFVGGFALSFVPVFKGHKYLPVIGVAVLAVITGIIIVAVI